jgi:hypothetical protein
MANESGDMKLLGNFSKLIELIATDSNYNPANPKLKVPALNAQKTAAEAAIADIGTKEAPLKLAINDRQTAFEDLRPIVTRSANMLKASGADKKLQDDARTFQRKISGQRKTPKAKDQPNTPANEADKNHSASQQSYDNVAGNFAAYVALLATVSSYAPNEPDLAIAGLQARSANLLARNQAVNTTFAPVSAARGVRDGLLYTNDDSVVNVALLAKAYVRAAFGPQSQLFKQIRGLQFKRPGS